MVTAANTSVHGQWQLVFLHSSERNGTEPIYHTYKNSYKAKLL